MEQLDGKVAVVTGAGGGIGFGLAQRFAEAGMRVVMADIDAALVRGSADELTKTGAEVLAVPTDVSDPESVHALAQAAYGTFGATHVLCNNAGLLGPPGNPMWELPLGEWERVLNVNVYGVIHGVHEFLPRMLAQGGEGHVVNTSSMVGFTSTPLIPQYAVSKHALVALTESLQLQLEMMGAPIGVSLLAPSSTRTTLMSKEASRASELPGAKDAAQTLAAVGETHGYMEPYDTAGIVVDAVRRNQFYIFPNVGSLERILDRNARVLAAFQ